jgi:hypothetical protein
MDCPPTQRRIAMSNQQLDHLESVNTASDNQDDAIEPSPTTKLQRRRRIEDLFEEKRMREELGEFDLL